jgi:hypothetical protein
MKLSRPFEIMVLVFFENEVGKMLSKSAGLRCDSGVLNRGFMNANIPFIFIDVRGVKRQSPQFIVWLNHRALGHNNRYEVGIGYHEEGDSIRRFHIIRTDGFECDS